MFNVFLRDVTDIYNKERFRPSSMAFGKTERMFSEDILVKKQKKIFVLSSSLSRTVKDGQSRWLDCLCTVHITTPDVLWCDEAHGIVGTFFHTHVFQRFRERANLQNGSLHYLFRMSRVRVRLC